MRSYKYIIAALIILAIVIYFALNRGMQDELTSNNEMPSMNADEYSEASIIDKLERKVVSLVSGKKLKAQKMFTHHVDFIGKILDQNSMPVSGAEINISVRYYPFVPNLDLSRSTSKFTAVTNADGIFAFEDLSGVSIIIDNISKQGYIFDTSENYYDFKSMDTSATAKLGSYSEPLLFRAWKQSGLKGSTYKTFEFYIVPDARKYFVDLDGENITSDEGKSDLYISASRENMTNGDYFLNSWGIKLSIPGGGILKNSQEFNYMAPESGYLTDWEYEAGNTRSNWSPQFEQQDLFMLLHDGRYVNVKLSVYPFYGYHNDKYRVVLEFALNEAGKRSFEPAHEH